MKELSLSNIVSIILHRIWLVILVAIICATAAYGYYNYVATPVYSARASVLINNGGLFSDSYDGYNSPINTNDLSASIYLVDTCVDILKSQGIYQELSDALNKEYSFQQLKGAFSVKKRADENLFIDISFRSTDPAEAVAIVNAFRDITPSYMKSKLPAVRIEPMDMAVGAGIIYPSTMTSSFLFGFLGAAITSIILVLFATLDQTIKSEEDFVETFDIPVLGAVPDFDNSPTYAYRSKTGSVSTGG